MKKIAPLIIVVAIIGAGIWYIGDKSQSPAPPTPVSGDMKALDAQTQDASQASAPPAPVSGKKAETQTQQPVSQQGGKPSAAGSANSDLDADMKTLDAQMQDASQASVSANDTSDKPIQQTE